MVVLMCIVLHGSFAKGEDGGALHLKAMTKSILTPM